MPKLTVGMAHHTDFSGVYFTIQHIRQTTKRIEEVEFVVVDSSGGALLPVCAEHRLDVRNFVGNCQRGTAGAKMVEMTEEEGFGTSQPRNRVFAEASGDAVVCMDCHVLPVPGSMDRLIEWYEQHDTLDLYQGPILHDDMSVMATHFEDEWRDQMWGIWEKKDIDLNNGKPFEIGAMGLGLFSCRREAWLGFNPHFRAFGGEEWYIHEKFRKQGRKCWCLPWLQWNHRFGRPDGIAYTITREHKVRNYILGCQELGIPLDRLEEHFITSGLVSREMYEKLLADPVNNIPPRSVPKATRSQGAPEKPNHLVPNNDVQYLDAHRPQPPANSTLDEIFRWCRLVPRDLNEHLDTLKEWSEKCDTVIEFSERRESTVGLLAGRPKSFISFNKERDILFAHPDGALHKAIRKQNDYNKSKGRDITTFSTALGGDSLQVEIPEVDLLFIDTQHTATRLGAELMKHGHKVKRAIVVHDTVAYGQTGDDGGPGLTVALSFWIKENPEWFVAYHTATQFGLTIISKDERDRPEEIIHAWPPDFGPGTELKAILKSIGVEPGPHCDCNARATQMDMWGVQKCKENFETICQWLRDGQEKWGWKSKWGAAAKLVAKTPLLAFKLNPKDPFPGLVKESIKRAERKERSERP